MTPHNPSCHAFAEELSAFIDGELAPVDAGRVERHLVECADCRRTVAALRDVSSAVASLPRMTAPPELLARVRHAAANLAHDPHSGQKDRGARAVSNDRRRLRALRWMGSLTGLAAVLVAAFVLRRNLRFVEPPVIGGNPTVTHADSQTPRADAPRIALREPSLGARDATNTPTALPAAERAPGRDASPSRTAAVPPVIAHSREVHGAPESSMPGALADAENSAIDEPAAHAMKKSATPVAPDDTLGLDPLTRTRLAELGYIGDDVNAVKDTSILDALTQSTDALLMESIVAAVPRDVEPPRVSDFNADALPDAVVDVVCAPVDHAEYLTALDAHRRLFLSNRDVVTPHPPGPASNQAFAPTSPVAEQRDQTVAGRAVAGGGGGIPAELVSHYPLEPTDTELAVSPALASDWVNYLANSAPRRVAVAAPLDVCRLIQSSNAFQQQQLVLLENPASDPSADPSATMAELGRAIQSQSASDLKLGVPVFEAAPPVDSAARSVSAGNENQPARFAAPSLPPQSSPGESTGDPVGLATLDDSRLPREHADERHRSRRLGDGRADAQHAVQSDDVRRESDDDSKNKKATAAAHDGFRQPLNSPPYAEDLSPTTQPLHARAAAHGQVLLRVRILPPPQPSASQPARNR